MADAKLKSANRMFLDLEDFLKRGEAEQAAVLMGQLIREYELDAEEFEDALRGELN